MYKKRNNINDIKIQFFHSLEIDIFQLKIQYFKGAFLKFSIVKLVHDTAYLAINCWKRIHN